MWFFPSWLSFTFVWYLCSFMLIPDKYFHNYQSCRNPFSVVNAKHKVKVVYRIRDTEYWEKYYWQLFSMVSCKREQDLKRVWGQSRYLTWTGSVINGAETQAGIMQAKLGQAAHFQPKSLRHCGVLPLLLKETPGSDDLHSHHRVHQTWLTNWWQWTSALVGRTNRHHRNLSYIEISHEI